MSVPATVNLSLKTATAEAIPVEGSELPVTGIEAIAVVPLEKITRPDGGLPKLLVFTVAVSVTEPPRAMLELLALSVVVVAACVITKTAGVAVLGLKLASPL